MLYLVVALAVLLAVSYSVYRGADSERVGFKALVAWVACAALLAAALIAWAVRSLAS